jgi:hypothetical protein
MTDKLKTQTDEEDEEEGDRDVVLSVCPVAEGLVRPNVEKLRRRHFFSSFILSNE